MSRHANRRRPQRGQSLVIFALIAVVLFAVVGLAVDAGFSYFASDNLERGAMAGALAGVPDMPDFNTAPNDATSTAIAATAKNGWTAGGANNVAISVAKVPDPNNAGLYLNNQLQVTVASDVPVFFLKLLGFGTHREARTAVAEYLRPITFGQPGSQLGSTMAALGTSNNFYYMRSEGWGTDRGQGDAYGPNPANAWTGSASTPNVDVHALSGTNGTEPASQPLAGMPARGGQNYTIYVPPGQTAFVHVYNPVFAPDNGLGSPVANPTYNYHEDDGDFPESGAGCSGGNGQGTGTCAGPASTQQWPVMSYTVYKSANPFDHSGDQWLSNLRVNSIDAANSTPSGATPGKYTIPSSGVGTTHTLANLTYYHQWVDVQTTPPAGLAKNITVGGAPTFNGSAGDGLSGGLTGTTYRLRVDQLDNTSGDPGTNGLAQGQNSQAHKGYAVEATGCGATPSTSCSVTALDDITLYTPVKAGGFTMPLVSIPPEYAGRTFSLYIYDPGDVTCNVNGCSNVLSLTQPTNSGTAQATAQTTDGVYSGQSGEGSAANPATWTQQVTAGNASIQTQNQSASPPNIYNGLWIRFDISVPADYASGGTPDVDSANPATWFWYLSYTTSQPAGDTITANLGFTGAPVHLVSG